MKGNEGEHPPYPRAAFIPAINGGVFYGILINMEKTEKRAFTVFSFYILSIPTTYIAYLS
jgi:hypothetical protein